MNRKKVLITGAAGGIGSAVARQLHTLGYEMTLLERPGVDLSSLLSELDNATGEYVDLSDREALASYCGELSESQFDLAIINAGIVFTGDVVDMPMEQIDVQIEVNLRAAIMLNRALSTSMIERQRGHIISTVSMAGIMPLKGTAVYTASKFGLRGFLSSLYSELKTKGVYVSGIYPSGVNTAQLRYEATSGGSPLNFVSEVQSAEQVAKAVVRTLDTKKLEVYVSPWDGFAGRVVAFFPTLLDRLYPLLEKAGKKGLKKYLSKIQSELL